MSHNRWNILAFYSSSTRKLTIIATSTPHLTYKPRVNFHSIESLATSSLNTSSFSPSSSFFCQKQGKSYSICWLSQNRKEIGFFKWVVKRQGKYKLKFSPEKTTFSFISNIIILFCFLDDTGYSSFNSSALALDKENTENAHRSTTTGERKVYLFESCKNKILSISFQPRRKLSDWQIWHLRQVFTNNRYPTPDEQEQLAIQLLLPLSSIRIWFQNHRARSGKKWLMLFLFYYIVCFSIKKWHGL